jgi:tol-pal system protein YbgF
MKQFRAAVLIFVPLLGTACASSPAAEPETTPAAQTAASDPRPDERMVEMQTQLTELLDRIDVLNQRIAQLEENQAAPAPVTVAARPAAPSPTAPAPRQEPAAAAAPVEPQRALVGAQLAENYRQAIILFGGGKHAEARRGFQSVFDADPSGDLADNALFWIGETYFAAKDYTNAVRHYQRVVSDYSTQNKAPDALFKIAMAQERTGDLALARRTLQQVIDRFPYSSPASSAKAELDRIKF